MWPHPKKSIVISMAAMLTVNPAMADKYGLEELARDVPIGGNFSGLAPALGALLVVAVFVRVLLIWLRIPGSGGFLGSLGKFVLVLCTAYLGLAAFFGCIAAVTWMFRQVGLDAPWLSFMVGSAAAWKAATWAIEKTNRAESPQPSEVSPRDDARDERHLPVKSDQLLDSSRHGKAESAAPVAAPQPLVSQFDQRLSASEVEALLEDAKAASLRIKELRKAEAKGKL